MKTKARTISLTPGQTTKFPKIEFNLHPIVILVPAPPPAPSDRFTHYPVDMLEKRAEAIRDRLPEFAEQARKKLDQVRLIFMYLRRIADIAGTIEPGNANDKPAEVSRFWRHIRRGTVALLKKSFDEFAKQVTTLLVTEPLFTTALTKAFARVGYALVPNQIEAMAIEPPEMPPPTVAPRLWADRPAGMKAAQFLKETYAPWIEAGVLTRAALKECDKPLYHAYHVWVHRHPEDAIAFKDTPQPHFIADPAEAIERRRAAIRTSKAKARARARDSLSQNPA